MVYFLNRIKKDLHYKEKVEQLLCGKTTDKTNQIKKSFSLY